MQQHMKSRSEIIRATLPFSRRKQPFNIFLKTQAAVQKLECCIFTDYGYYG